MIRLARLTFFSSPDCSTQSLTFACPASSHELVLRHFACTRVLDDGIDCRSRGVGGMQNVYFAFDAWPRHRHHTYNNRDEYPPTRNSARGWRISQSTSPGCFEGSFAALTPSSPPVTLSKAWCSWGVLGLGEADQRPDPKVIQLNFSKRSCHIARLPMGCEACEPLALGPIQELAKVID
ncbi:hypothetical protein BDP81DRAFT_214971 [Colletotrichum phormii]|uniref:Uncharacterized protein n=1 Tax=Colletotrichum phormii TaxID=359342 RepID=A0AAI9ZTF9_9PEZI|nr:uncharacterized protein BDP81DRAFT_214971 [Colletotrichum phormii]KAK1637887.1 hypothetical protein BDP81DRAFT_214971 [Colletotrichum phormii]